MSPNAADTVSFVAGSVTALVVHVADVVSVNGAMEVASTLVFGFLGGMAGYAGRLFLDYLRTRNDKTNERKQ